MMHRIGDANRYGLPANCNMTIPANTFEAFIRRARQRNWNFISIDELASELRKGKIPKKTLVLTFDDGYKDNYTIGLPIFKAFNIPFCVYITTKFIEQDVTPWWYVLENVIQANEQIKDPFGNSYILDGIQNKNNAFLKIRHEILRDRVMAAEILNWLEESKNLLPQNEISSLFMNWDDLLNLETEGLATIGAHTHSHPVLSQLTHKEALVEISKAKAILEARLKTKVINHFALPFGGEGEFSDREIRMAKEVGFLSTVSTINGGLYSWGKIDSYKLPRVFFHSDIDLALNFFTRLTASKLKRSIYTLGKNVLKIQ